MVRIFKTNIKSLLQAKQFVAELSQHYPEHQINFDLEDCDNILRMQGPEVSLQALVRLFALKGCQCAELE